MCCDMMSYTARCSCLFVVIPYSFTQSLTWVEKLKIILIRGKEEGEGEKGKRRRQKKKKDTEGFLDSVCSATSMYHSSMYYLIMDVMTQYPTRIDSVQMMMDCDGSYVLCFIVHAIYRNTTPSVRSLGCPNCPRK